MDIAITPDTYCPIVNEEGSYVDKIPIIRNGIYCVCGARRDKVYETASKFSSHIKSKAHQKWLIQLNNNKANYYVELLQNKELVEQQKKMLSQLEVQLKTKSLTIDYLTQQLNNAKKIEPQQPTMNLLDI